MVRSAQWLQPRVRAAAPRGRRYLRLGLELAAQRRAAGPNSPTPHRVLFASDRRRPRPTARPRWPGTMARCGRRTEQVGGVARRQPRPPLRGRPPVPGPQVWWHLGARRIPHRCLDTEVRTVTLVLEGEAAGRWLRRTGFRAARAASARSRGPLRGAGYVLDTRLHQWLRLSDLAASAGLRLTRVRRRWAADTMRTLHGPACAASSILASPDRGASSPSPE